MNRNIWGRFSALIVSVRNDLKEFKKLSFLFPSNRQIASVSKIHETFAGYGYHGTLCELAWICCIKILSWYRFEILRLEGGVIWCAIYEYRSENGKFFITPSSPSPTFVQPVDYCCHSLYQRGKYGSALSVAALSNACNLNILLYQHCFRPPIVQKCLWLFSFLWQKISKLLRTIGIGG